LPQQGKALAIFFLTLFQCRGLGFGNRLLAIIAIGCDDMCYLLFGYYIGTTATSQQQRNQHPYKGKLALFAHNLDSLDPINKLSEDKL
jgi:hypothetical protein